MFNRLMIVTVIAAGCGGCFCTESKPHPYTVNVRSGASLTAVRDAVRALPASNRLNGVEVVLAPGRYLLKEALNFTAADGGTTAAPIVWRVSRGGRAILSEGAELPVTAFRPASGPGAERIDPSVRDKVLALDLAGLPVSFWKPRKSEFRQPSPIPELFMDGMRMTPAQWPNEGWSTIARFVAPGTKDNDGSVGDALGTAKKKAIPPQGGTFGFEGDRPLRWARAPEVWLHGFWCFDWYDAVIPVAAINSVSNTITFAAKHTYGIRRGNPSPRRWKAVHLLEELDVPGEYYIDPSAKRLYFMPPSPLVSGQTRLVLTSSASGRNLLVCEGVSGLVFRGLDFEECFGDAVAMKACKEVSFVSCRFRNMRGKAICVSDDCSNCRVLSCDISETGTGGITLGGGVRATLTPGNNVVEDTLIRNFSKRCLTYAAAVHLTGVGNRVSHCEISGAPHLAVSVNGNDHIIEYSVISNVCMSSDDASAFYKGRNPSCRGNVLRYNYWSRIGSPRGHGNAAVYFDDGDGGDVVFGNVFYKSGEPGKGSFGTVFSHGGHSNIVDNCLFIDCKRPLGSSPWPQKRWENFLKSPLEQHRLLKDVDISRPPYTTHYPELVGFLTPEPDAARWNLAVRTAFVDCPEVLKGRWTTNATDVVFTSDPGFVNAAAENFTLKPDAEIYRKIPGFKSIPFEKIGLIHRR